MSVTLAYSTELTATEVLANNTVGFSNTANRTVTHSALNKNATFTSATTPPVTTVVTFLQALSDGTATIDLTSLTGTNGATVTGSGLKVQAVKFAAASTNANVISIGEGAANGYELLGNGWTIALAASQEAVFFLNDAAPDIAAGAKDIDLAGTGTQGVNVSIVMG